MIICRFIVKCAGVRDRCEAILHFMCGHRECGIAMRQCIFTSSSMPSCEWTRDGKVSLFHYAANKKSHYDSRCCQLANVIAKHPTGSLIIDQCEEPHMLVDLMSTQFRFEIKKHEQG